MAPPKRRRVRRRSRRTSTSSGADIQSLNLTSNHFLRSTRRAWMATDDQLKNPDQPIRSQPQHSTISQTSRGAQDALAVPPSGADREVIWIDSDTDNDEEHYIRKSIALASTSEDPSRKALIGLGPRYDALEDGGEDCSRYRNMAGEAIDSPNISAENVKYYPSRPAGTTRLEPLRVSAAHSDSLSSAVAKTHCGHVVAIHSTPSSLLSSFNNTKECRQTQFADHLLSAEE